jgi:hypothetical protein
VKRGKCYTGLPSRHPLDGGPFFFRFWIGNRLIAYEWAMVLADHHPYLPWFGDIKGKTTEDMQKRESRLVSETAWAIYHELKAEFEAKRLSPLRREFCADEPRMLDFTRCVFGLDQVLTLIRRRGDTGWLIGKLLARYPTANDAVHGAEPRGETLEVRVEQDSLADADATAAAGYKLDTGCRKETTKAAVPNQVDDRPTAPCDTAETAGDATIDKLAEWIFARRSQRKTSKALLAEALEAGEFGSFTKADFTTAYGMVYATVRNAPPASGWPLHSPYKERHSKSQKCFKSPGL